MIKEVLVSPQIDPELRKPVPPPEREIRPIAEGGLDDVGLLLTDFSESLDEANSQITAIDVTLTAFEARVLKNQCAADPTLEACQALEE